MNTSIDIPILYEDNDILALNKPAGIAVHGDGRTSRYTIADWILEKYPDMADVGEPMRAVDGSLIRKPGIVHRLDAGTTGVLIVAKTQEAFLFLKKQFQGREVKKTYRALAHGIITQDEGVIDAPIGKSRADFRRWSAERGSRGAMREARTDYKVLKRFDDTVTRQFFGNFPSSGGVSYIEAYPRTGRTHQIRVHFKAIQHPLLCDALYAPKRPCILGFSRPALHALAIELTLPGGAPFRAEAPLPADFLEALALLHTGTVAKK